MTTGKKPTANFRRNRLLGLFAAAAGALVIAVTLSPVASSIYRFLFSLFGSFTNNLVVLPYLLIVLGIFWYFRTENTESKFIERAYESAYELHREQPQKNKPVWDMAQLTLEIYFNRNLNQIRWIFWLSIVVMSLGFFLILYGVALGYQNPKENWIIAGIGGIAGVVTEFIGSTFLFVYKSSIQQANKYTEILERMNFVGMAMQVLDSISTEEKVGEQPPSEESLKSLRDAKIEMAKALLNKLQTNTMQDPRE